MQIAHFTALRGALGRAAAPGVDLVLERARVAQDDGNDALALALDDARGSDLEGRLAALSAEEDG